MFGTNSDNFLYFLHYWVVAQLDCPFKLLRIRYNSDLVMFLECSFFKGMY